MQPVQLSLKSIQHVGIPVTDIKTSETFYNNLGFENVMKANFMHDSEPGICVMMKQEDIIIELYQMPQRELAAVAARKDGHVDHVAFDVADIEKTFSILKDAGYKILESTPVLLQFWNNGCKYFNIVGPEGERLEFNQVL